MWKDIGKLFIRLISVVLPVCIFLMLYAAVFPMYYLDPEYAMYKQQKDGMGKTKTVLNEHRGAIQHIFIVSDS